MSQDLENIEFDGSEVVSASISDVELRQYLRWRTEIEEENTSEAIRESLRIAAEADDEYQQFISGEQTSTDDEVDVDEDGADEALVPVDSIDGDDSGLVEADLSNPNSEAFREDAIVPVEEIGKSWKDIDALAGKWDDNKTDDSRGRRHAFIWVLNQIVEEDTYEGLGRRQIRDEFRDRLGVDFNQAETAVDRLITEDVLHPHPSTEDGILTEEFRTDVRMILADKAEGPEVDWRKRANDSTALDDLEQSRYPDDWSELLSGFERFYRNRYYRSEKRYLDELVDVMRSSILLSAFTNKSKSRSTKDAMSGEEMAHVWFLVSRRFANEMEDRLEGFGDLRGDYLGLAVEAKELPYKRERAPQKWEDVLERMAELTARMEQLVERNKSAGDADGEMSVPEAMDVFGWTDLDGFTTEDVQQRKRALSKKHHPDAVDDAGSAMDATEQFKTIMDAEDVLMEAVPEPSEVEASGSSSGSSNIGASSF